MFFDLADAPQIVEIVEPLFSNLNAAVDILTVMTGDDLRNLKSAIACLRLAA
jgi:hypothetical protein